MREFKYYVGAVLAIALLVGYVASGRGRTIKGPGTRITTSEQDEPDIPVILFKHEVAFEPAEEVIKQSFAASDQPTIMVETFSGSIAFEPGDGNSVQVEVVKRSRGLTEERAKEILKSINIVLQQSEKMILVKATCEIPILMNIREDSPVHMPGPFGPSVAIRIKGPNKANLEIRGNGNIDIRECGRAIVMARGTGSINIAKAHGVSASTGSGFITLRDCAGPIQLNSGTGRIDVRNASGSTRAVTGRGDIYLQGTAGEYFANAGEGDVQIFVDNSPVQAETAYGNIEIHGCIRAVKAVSSTGNVEVHGSDAVVDLRSNVGNVSYVGSLATGASNISTATGQSLIDLPSESHFKVHARTDRGNIFAPFPMTRTKELRTELIGSAGANPQVLLNMESKFGDVHVGK